MAYYIVADIDVTNPEEYKNYAQHTPATLEKYGGKFIVRGGQSETLEGNWQPKRIVIIEFSSAEQAKNWYNSPEYQAIIGIRQRSTVSNILLVQGA